MEKGNESQDSFWLRRDLARVYEKAFAKLKTGTSTDMPDITQTAWGDCVGATAQLNGRDAPLQRHGQPFG